MIKNFINFLAIAAVILVYILFLPAAIVLVILLILLSLPTAIVLEVLEGH